MINEYDRKILIDYRLGQAKETINTGNAKRNDRIHKYA